MRTSSRRLFLRTLCTAWATLLFAFVAACGGVEAQMDPAVWSTGAPPPSHQVTDAGAVPADAWSPPPSRPAATTPVAGGTGSAPPDAWTTAAAAQDEGRVQSSDEGAIPPSDEGPSQSASGDAPGESPAPAQPVEWSEASDPCPGCPGAPCENGSYCASGWCINVADQPECAATCEQGCAPGFGCQDFERRDGTIESICIWQHHSYCLPCREDYHCVDEDGGDAPAVCLELDPSAGRFCATACASDADCPTGARCDMVEIDGQERGLCRPADLTCECSIHAVVAKLSATCSSSNEHGTCEGSRTCTEDGLTECDAAVPAPERCGGGDEDCDGVVDEEGASGCRDYFEDRDRDGFGAGESHCLCFPFGDFRATGAGDCLDSDPAMNAGAQEICGNSIDDDCDGETDEPGSLGCTDLFEDVDGDGYGAGVARCLCDMVEGFVTEINGDCDDGDRAVAPEGDERCNGVDDDCDGTMDESGAEGCTAHYADVDADGFGDPRTSACLCAPDATYPTTDDGDCHDGDAAVGPGTPERCDAIDNDCDGVVDPPGAEGCALHYQDLDGDGAGAGEGRCLCSPEGVWSAPAAGDCHDGDDAVFEGAAELCNGRDDDCDGEIDEPGAADCLTFYADVDGDQHGNPDDSACLCSASDRHTALIAEDCSDGEARAHSDAKEVCDGFDNDCDGEIDEGAAEGCVLHYVDEDGDGFGAPSAMCLCKPTNAYAVLEAGDCDDTNPLVRPGAVEVCNGIDDQCDGQVDEHDALGCVNRFVDSDGDGFGREVSRCTCTPTELWSVEISGDCDDGDDAVHPAGAEACNGVDDDCDGEVDELGARGCSFHFADGDGDGHGAGTPACLCAPTHEHPVDVGGDCDDTDGHVSPAADERCNGVDDDCDGAIDTEGATTCTTYYEDFDGDTFGRAASRCLCAVDGAFRTTRKGDCDDTDPTVHPDAVEVCGGGDEDCDGVVDEKDARGCRSHYVDGDGDGFGAGFADCLCAPEGAFDATVAGDCDDASRDVHPAAAERCNLVDDDCDGETDDAGAEGCRVFYADADRDGVGDERASACLCEPNSDYSTLHAGDCDDTSKAAREGAREVCDGRDNDCDGTIDEEDAEGCMPFYVDVDGDGFGVGSARCLCNPIALHRGPAPGDCNDGDPSVHPNAAEVCGGADDDCDGKVDEESATGCEPHFADRDGDGFGNALDERCLCSPSGVHGVRDATDCDDTNARIHPSAFESCITTYDDNCDGDTERSQDGSGTVYYVDNDGDGYGAGNASAERCSAPAANMVAVAGDCNDHAPLVHPGAAELCNGFDDDCDGRKDEDFRVDEDAVNDDHPSYGGSHPWISTSKRGTTWLALEYRDQDWVRVRADEEVVDGRTGSCKDSEHPDPMVAVINFAPSRAGTYEVCTCFSSEGSVCDRSSVECALLEPDDFQRVGVAVVRSMKCGERATGYLDAWVLQRDVGRSCGATHELTWILFTDPNTLGR